MSKKRIAHSHRFQKIKLSPNCIAALKQLKQAFKEKFGREPGPNDPIFFDPDCDVPIPMDEHKFTRELIEAMKRAKLPPEKIYATEKTGFVATEDNWYLLSISQKEEWRTALDEYFALNKGKS